MIKRFLALLCCLLLAASVAQAAIDWPVLTTQGQQAAQTYIAQVNANLSSLGAANINSLFECYPVIMSLGITAQDNADTPEGVELSLQLQEEGMVSLTVRSIYPDSFGALAGSCVQAADPSRTLEDTVNEAAAKAALAQQSPDDSFEDVMGETDWYQGNTLRVYYAYRPDEYSDGNNWLQAVLIFPFTGLPTAQPTLEPTATPTLIPDEEVTPTPRLVEFSPKPDGV